jgi:acylphosphatase
MVRYRIRVTGKVQGVFFRKCTKDEADRAGIKGIVRNEQDGSVYIEAEGKITDVKRFIEWCWKGSPSSAVDNVTAEEASPKGYKDFSVERH